jgi:hypothetical protein
MPEASDLDDSIGPEGPKAATAHAKLLGTMETIAAMPNGFVTGARLYDLNTGRLHR